MGRRFHSWGKFWESRGNNLPFPSENGNIGEHRAPYSMPDVAALTVRTVPRRLQSESLRRAMKSGLQTEDLSPDSRPKNPYGSWPGVESSNATGQREGFFLRPGAIDALHASLENHYQDDDRLLSAVLGGRSLNRRFCQCFHTARRLAHRHELLHSGVELEHRISSKSGSGNYEYKYQAPNSKARITRCGIKVPNTDPDPSNLKSSMKSSSVPVG